MSQEFIINLESKVDKLKSQLHKLETAKSVDEITVQDVYEMHPELKEEVHQMIRDDHWAVKEESGNVKKEEGSGDGETKEKLNYL